MIRTVLILSRRRAIRSSSDRSVAKLYIDHTENRCQPHRRRQTFRVAQGTDIHGLSRRSVVSGQVYQLIDEKSDFAVHSVTPCRARTFERR